MAAVIGGCRRAAAAHRRRRRRRRLSQLPTPISSRVVASTVSRSTPSFTEFYRVSHRFDGPRLDFRFDYVSILLLAMISIDFFTKRIENSVRIDFLPHKFETDFFFFIALTLWPSFRNRIFSSPFRLPSFLLVLFLPKLDLVARFIAAFLFFSPSALRFQ